MSQIYLFLVIMGCLWLALPFAIKKTQIALLRLRCRYGHIIVLTYDDGPSIQVTDKILNILHGYNAVATFFLLGHKLSELAEKASKIIAGGHEIGSHSHQHLHAWKCNPVSVSLDIQKGLRAVYALTNCRLFRAPYGKITLGTLIQLWLQDFRQAWWTVDSTDTWEKPHGIEEILNHIRKDGGGVVLMHDIDRPERPECEKFVLDLTRALLEMAKNEGFKVCRLGEVI